MYKTVKETADYLSLPEAYIEQMIVQGRIRTVFDGNQDMVYIGQFDTHLEQMEKYKQQQAEWNNEPIPEDLDIKDED